MVENENPAPTSANGSPLRRYTSTSSALLSGVELAPHRPEPFAVGADQAGHEGQGLM
jgi:hypothetical protein